MAAKEDKEPNKVGRPTIWTPEKIKEASRYILDEMVKGKSVRSILNPATRDKDKLPSYVEFLEWIDADKELSKQYARAMDWRAEGLLEDTIVIADDSADDIVETYDQEGNLVMKADIEHIQRTRLRIEARQFALRKMAPKKYGDKVDVTTNGENVNSPAMLLTPEMIKELTEKL